MAHLGELLKLAAHALHHYSGLGDTRRPIETLGYRLALDGDRVVRDPDRRRPGRGAWVCGDDCLRTAVQRRTLSRAFRRAVSAAPDVVDSGD